MVNKGDRVMMGYRVKDGLLVIKDLGQYFITTSKRGCFVILYIGLFTIEAEIRRPDKIEKIVIENIAKVEKTRRALIPYIENLIKTRGTLVPIEER